jgi:hypothetical protein
LREQAEASIKDKVATMSIHEVLSDKRPIIEELTRRIKDVAEGAGEGGGLGIKIVTVQIKEAVVSSTRLWENLQGPFRAEQRTQARLAEIEADQRIGERERTERQVRESAEIETEAKIETLRANKAAETYDRDQAEAVRRHRLDQEAARKRAEEKAETERRQKAEEEALRLQALELQYQYNLEAQARASEGQQKKLELQMHGYQKEIEELKARLEKELVARETHWSLEAREVGEHSRVEAERLAARLERERIENEARNAQTEKDLAFEAERQDTSNRLSEEFVRLEAMRGIPAIARALPKPEHLQAVSLGGDTSNLAGLLAQVMAVLRGFGVAETGRFPGEDSPRPEAAESDLQVQE